MADSFEYFLNRGLSSVDFSVQVTDTSDWRIERIDELESQFARIYEASLRHYERTGDVVFDMFRRRGASSAKNNDRPRRLGMCGVGRGEALTVDVDGEVHGCVMFADSYQRFPTELLRQRLGAMKMGDLRDAEFPMRLAAYPTAARAAEIFDNKQDKFSSYGRCRDCAYLRSCSLCPVSIANTPGSTDPRRIPDFACAYNLVAQKYRLKFPVQGNAIDFVTGRSLVPGMMLELRNAARVLGREPG